VKPELSKRREQACLVLAAALLLLAPLPALRDLTEIAIPAGLDPVNGLVVLALVAALVVGIRLRAREWGWLFAVAALNLALLLVAWLRRYGHEVSRESVALYGHQVVIVFAGTLAALLAGRGERARERVALVLWAGLVVLALSIFAEALGVYNPPVAERSGVLAVQPNGGFMLQANEAGALFATYGVPTAVLLRVAGRQRFAVGLLALSLAALAVTQSRESIGTFGVALLAGAVLTGYIARARYGLVALVAFVSSWAIAAPGAFAKISSDTNTFLSGRPSLWHEALRYLGQDNNWLWGGGLDGFESYVQRKLGHPFTTHSEPFRLLVDGGVIMLAGYVVLVLALWWLALRAGGTIGLALQVGVLSFVLVGLVKDFGPFTRAAAWLWALAALAVLAIEDQRAADSRP
jgi:O-antigen ligase/polysaccharide polymerase Wzy-like membrane protein